MTAVTNVTSGINETASEPRWFVQGIPGEQTLFASTIKCFSIPSLPPPFLISLYCEAAVAQD